MFLPRQPSAGFLKLVEKQAEVAWSLDNAEDTLVRLAYSSVLCADSLWKALNLVSSIVSQSLRNNPGQHIGGILFFDEVSFTMAQVAHCNPTLQPIFHDVPLDSLAGARRPRRKCENSSRKD